MVEVIKRLSGEDDSVNVTAMMSTARVCYMLENLKHSGLTHYVSVFAGRIVDTGVDALPLMGGDGWHSQSDSARELDMG